MDNKIVVTCPKCGSPDVTADALARRNIDTQTWELSSEFENKDCGSCLYSGKVFNETVIGDLTQSQRDFIENKVEDYVLPLNG